MTNLESGSIHAWIVANEIKNEAGEPIDFVSHPFLFDIYRDFSPKLCVMKAAQVGMTTAEILKLFWATYYKDLDTIYILPTAEDVRAMVGAKVNRIVAQNPILQQWVKDKDSIEQKQIGERFCHFKGSWSQKEAIMITSDWNLIDEVDSSKQDVIAQYATRLQHSKHRWEHYFSHPSASGFGIDKYWQISDQKHWLIKCEGCNEEQYLSWPESIDEEREVYQCKFCKKELTDKERKRGRWAQKKGKEDAEYSGYWISLLMCPWITAKDILSYYQEKPEDYFYNKVLGLPYIGGGNKLTWELFSQNLTKELITPLEDEPAVMGIDTGLKIDYVMGSQKGLFYHGEAEDYDELDKHMKRWPKMIAVIDAGGDLIGSRKFKERWKGRVYLCYTGGDRKTEELVSFGTGDEYYTIRADRNRLIQLVVDEFRDGRIPCEGTEEDWLDYWTDWQNLTRVKQFDPTTQEFKSFKWVRSGRDHRALASIYWRAGMMKFGYGKADFIGEKPRHLAPVSAEMKPDQSWRPVLPDGRDPIEATMQELQNPSKSDWRDI